jgi:hypothetical protein
MAIFNSYVSLPEGTTPKSSDYSHGNLAQPFLSRGRNRAGLIWTWWVFGKPRGEFLAMDGNGQHANI